MMFAMSLSSLQEICGGRLYLPANASADLEFTSVAIDTRKLGLQSLFIALPGAKVNGAEFIHAAKVAGAVAAVTEIQKDCTLPQLIVSDAAKALALIGKANRTLSKATVLALTGSQGKTTVKELCSSILAHLGSTLATEGNLNNHLGVPLMLTRLNSTHKYAVMELGANCQGEIAFLVALVEPDLALINCVASTHLEGFGSLRGVADGKSEIWRGLDNQGIAIVNLDDDMVTNSYRAVEGVKRVNISANGSYQADYRINNLHLKGLAGSVFDLVTPEGQATVSLTLSGEHNAANALAAAALCMEAGASLEQVVAGLSIVGQFSGRMEILSGPHGACIINDTYNASPASFSAALKVLQAQFGKRILVVGDMAELGGDAKKLHSALGFEARELKIDQLIGIGPLSQYVCEAFGENAHHVNSIEEIIALLSPQFDSHTTLLIKGSRSARMERVVNAIRN
jgi:UDP-N-acetylmuramoyl-tripeptide--D-alanyl-D-alanine ligase